MIEVRVEGLVDIYKQTNKKETNIDTFSFSLGFSTYLAVLC